MFLGGGEGTPPVCHPTCLQDPLPLPPVGRAEHVRVKWLPCTLALHLPEGLCHTPLRSSCKQRAAAQRDPLALPRVTLPMHAGLGRGEAKGSPCAPIHRGVTRHCQAAVERRFSDSRSATKPSAAAGAGCVPL